MTEQITNSFSKSELAAQIDDLQHRLAELEQTTTSSPLTAAAPAEEQSFGRRALLRRAGTMAAGAVAATVASGAFRPASAGTGIGGNLQIGQANISSSANTPQTLLKVTSLAPADTAVFTVTDGTSITTTQRAAIAGVGGTVVDHGVVGATTAALSFGVLGVGTAANSIGIGAASNFAHLKLTDSGGTTANLPTTASLLARSALAGHIVFDRSHNLWLGTSGGWRRISGPVSAGSFSIITPIRVYDSRSFSKLDAGTNRLVQVTGLGTIPAGARAISATLTITGTDTSFGFLGITAGDIASTATSAINWFGAGQTMATTVMSALDATGKVKVFNDSPAGANTHFIIDVTGYYL